MADKVAQLDNPKVVRLYQLVARFVDDWEDEQLLHETADLIHELLEEAAASRAAGLAGRGRPRVHRPDGLVRRRSPPRGRAAAGAGQPAGLACDSRTVALGTPRRLEPAQHAALVVLHQVRRKSDEREARRTAIAT